MNTTLAQARDVQILPFAVGYAWTDEKGKKQSSRTVVPAVDGPAALNWMRRHYRRLDRIWLIQPPKGAKV